MVAPFVIFKTSYGLHVSWGSSDNISGIGCTCCGIFVDVIVKYAEIRLETPQIGETSIDTSNTAPWSLLVMLVKMWHIVTNITLGYRLYRIVYSKLTECKENHLRLAISLCSGPLIRFWLHMNHQVSSLWSARYRGSLPIPLFLGVIHDLSLLYRIQIHWTLKERYI